MNANKKPAGEISVITQPSEFFKEEVTKALTNQKIKTDENIECYLVNLLSRFMLSENLFKTEDNGSRREEVLALLLQEAVNAGNAERQQQSLRRLGDISLYTAGFFSDRFARKVIDVDYYIGMGKSAYGNLAQMDFDRLNQRVFSELSKSFHKFVDVLAEISESASKKDAKDILRLYEIWLKTRSERAEKSLKEAGIIPNNLVKPDFQ